MPTVIATRSELLDRRRRIRFGEQGRDLLKDKRATLVLEFQQHRADLLGDLDRLRELAITAQGRLDDARADLGPESLASAALSAETGIHVRVDARTVAGVPVIDLHRDELVRNPFQRGWARVLAPVQIDEAAHAHEQLLEHLLDLGARELTIRRLASAIARTTRQINALDNVLLPRLAEEAARITLTLDEREREEQARLRSARKRHAARDEARGPAHDHAEVPA